MEIVLCENFYGIYLGEILGLWINSDYFYPMVPDPYFLLKEFQRLMNDLQTLTENEFKKMWANIYSTIIRDNPIDKLDLLKGLSALYSCRPRIKGKQVYIPASFNDYFETSQSSRYSVLNISFFGHANSLLIDHQTKTLERYEPYFMIRGGHPELDTLLTEFAIEKGYCYFPPQEFCPRRGIQFIEKLFEFGKAYCVYWSILYAEERIKSDLPRKYVAKNLYQMIVDKYELRQVSPEETALAVEKWLIQRIDLVFIQMNDFFSVISEILQVNLTYHHGTLFYLLE